MNEATSTSTTAQPIPERDLLERFLFGELDAGEHEALETRAFEDDAVFEALEAVETDLFDAYARNELKGERRRRFEARMLRGPEGARRLAFAKGLRTHLTQTRDELAEAEPRRPWWRALLPDSGAWRLATVGALAGACVLALWLGSSVQRLRGQLDEARTELARIESDGAERTAASGGVPEAPPPGASGSEDLGRVVEESLERQRVLGERLAAQSQEIERLETALAAARETDQPAAPEPVVSSFVLSLAAVVRGVDEATAFVVSDAADRVRLEVDLESGGGYPSYRAAVRTAAGRELWSGSGLQELAIGGGPALRIELPAKIFAAGRHELILLGATPEGFEEVAFLDFEIERR